MEGTIYEFRPEVTGGTTLFGGRPGVILGPVGQAWRHLPAILEAFQVPPGRHNWRH